MVGGARRNEQATIVETFPIEPAALAPFLIAVLLIELTPGPNMGYLAALSASQGRAAGFKAVLGITLGLAFYMLLAVFGVAEVIAAAPLVYGALRWGACSICFISGGRPGVARTRHRRVTQTTLTTRHSGAGSLQMC